MIKITSQTPSSPEAVANREILYKLFETRPFSDSETLVNLSLFMRSGSLAKLLFLDEIYREIVSVPGCIFEFGTWLGATTVTFENLRAIHEPYNHLRRIHSFDTFDGYVGVTKEDVVSEVFKEILSGNTYMTPKSYENYLKQLIKYHELENVMSHIEKHSVHKGDVTQTLPIVLDSEPSTMIALAYFDLAAYLPTVLALRLVLPKMIKGGIIVFDELSHPDYPSETKVFFEEIVGTNYSIRRSRFLADRSIITLN